MSTPAQLVERLRDVYDGVMAKTRVGQPILRSDLEALAATAGSVAEELAELAGGARSAEMASAAMAVQALSAATLLAWDDPSGEPRAGIYGAATGELLAVLSNLASVPFTTYADEDAAPGPQN